MSAHQLNADLAKARPPITFKSVSVLMNMANEDPALLPHAMMRLSELEIGVLTSGGAVLTATYQNTKYFIAGVNPQLLIGEIDHFPGSIPSFTQGSALLNHLNRKNSDGTEIGMILRYGEVLEDQSIELKHMIVPPRLFDLSAKLPRNAGNIMVIDGSQNEICDDGRRELQKFFSMFPEVDSVYLTEKTVGSNTYTVLVMTAVNGAKFSNPFLLSAPALIMEKFGYNPKEVRCILSGISSPEDLHAQWIYSRKKA